MLEAQIKQGSYLMSNKNHHATLLYPAMLGLMLALGWGQASADEGQLQVSESVTLNASSAAVWALIGDFNGLYRWHPAVVNSTLEGDRSKAGSVRILALGNGARIVERQQSHNDAQHSYGYQILYSPLPISGYESQIMITDKGAKRCEVTWSSSFNAAGAPDTKAEEIIRGIYKGGLDNLAGLFN